MCISFYYIFYLSIIIISIILLFNSKEKFQDLNQDISKKITEINKKLPEKRTIFISVASYRDKECTNTLEEIYSKAKYPERIFVGICQQNNKDDPDCLNDYQKSKFKNNIRILRLKDIEAKGPTFARYHCSKLYQNEDYFLQIDSHTHFEKDWDELLIQMIQKTPQLKSVITTYPNDWKLEGKPDKDIPVFCSVKFENDMFGSTASLLKPSEKLREVPYVAAGFFFTYGIFLKEVPYDSDLPHLFHGEEILFAARLYTNGWNFYAPNKDIVYHYYTREEAPKYWTNKEYQKYQPLSFKKVQYLLNLTKEKPKDIKIDDRYTLGTQRSLKDFYNFIGFDEKNKKITKNFC